MEEKISRVLVSDYLTSSFNEWQLIGSGVIATQEPAVRSIIPQGLIKGASQQRCLPLEKRHQTLLHQLSAAPICLYFTVQIHFIITQWCHTL